MYIMAESRCKNNFPLNWFLVKKRTFAVRMHIERFFSYTMAQRGWGIKGLEWKLKG